MARFFPHPLPPEVLDDPRRAGERRIFEALKAGLNDEWLVLANISWLRQRYQGGVYEGEADAILAHPEKGIVVLEVKGGGIRRDGGSGLWFSRDRYGVEHEIKNPFEQARRSLGALRSMLADEVSVRFRSSPFAAGVAFPDLPAPVRALGPDAPLELGLFQDQIESVGSSLDRMLAFSNDSQSLVGPGVENLQAMRELLLPELNLDIPLSVRIRDDEEQLLRLTESQKQALTLLSRLRRVAVTGGAGTGKTVLAVEKARQLATQGADVLFLCFNNALARTVDTQCAGLDNLTARTFHGLCTEWARQAGVLPPMPSPVPPSFWDHDLPDAFLKALEALPRRFDAIVVDEGQDFLDDWWFHIEEATKDPGESILYVFHDDNQRIFGRASGIPLNLVSIPLSQNVRNTRAIHDAAATLYDGGEFFCQGPAGNPVEFFEVPESRSFEREIRRLLHRLIREEHLKPDDIAILSGRALDRSAVGRGGKIGDFACLPLAEARPDALVRDTVHRFKGLERPAVILVEMDAAVERPEILYVGLTRARSYLCVVDRPDTIGAIKQMTGA